MKAIGPERVRRRKLDLKKSAMQYELIPSQAGAYLALAASCKPGFVTKTTQGYKRQDKKGLKEVSLPASDTTCAPRP